MEYNCSGQQIEMPQQGKGLSEIGDQLRRHQDYPSVYLIRYKESI